MKKNKFNRRNLVKWGAASTGLFMVPTTKLLAADEDPHFYIQIHLDLGADSSYLFDGRSLAMKEAKLIQNYSNEDAQAWEGVNGTKGWAYSSMDPLKSIKDDFSIIRGVHMAVPSVSHDQNVNFFNGGNIFGGSWFGPIVAGGSSSPLGYVQMGTIFNVNFKNRGQGVIIGNSSFGSNPFKGLMNNALPGSEADPALAGIMQRFAATSTGSGLFSRGVGSMNSGLTNSKILAEALRKADANQAAEGEEEMTATTFQRNVSTAMEFMKGGVTSCALIVYEAESEAASVISAFDSHSSNICEDSPNFFRKFAEEFRDLINNLRNTPYDDQRSMLDLTTVVVETDFSRTMINDFSTPGEVDVDTQGSDHNPLTNTFLIAGKGVNGGLVIGDTDMESVEAHANPSGAHVQMDARKTKVVGKPFDFSTFTASAAKPETYQAIDYLTAGSVANTIMRIFDAPTSDYRGIQGQATTVKAPILDPLLKG